MVAPSSDLLCLVDEFVMLLQESADYQRHPDVKAVLTEAMAAVSASRRRLATAGERYVVAVVGLTNVGKSTLLNALLGDELAPRRNGPCTAAPIEFCYGERLQVIAYHHQSYTRPHWHCQNVEAVHQRLSQLADDGGAEASRRIRKVEVQARHSLLERGLVIADTPGFGAAQSLEALGSHEEALKRYLHQDVTQVFWVVLADQGIGQREKQFFEDFFAAVCDDIVVTQCEDWDPHDRERFRRRFADVLGNHLLRFHFVSGLKGLEARNAGDAARLETAGITLLESRIRELADPAGRTCSIRRTLIQLADDLSVWLREYRDDRGLPLEQWWRPDSWGRWKGAPSCGGLQEQIAASLVE